jgi:diguanylate cyclase (GGDEF)-like protein
MVRIEQELARLRGNESAQTAVLMCDLDHFKLINDGYGHALGDRVLQHFAAIVNRGLRKNDVVGRFGGEEFAIVLPDTRTEEACAFAHRLQQRIAQAPLREGGHHIVLTVSIGIAAMSNRDASAHAVLSRSDKALYRAKTNGRNRIEVD